MKARERAFRVGLRLATLAVMIWAGWGYRPVFYVVLAYGVVALGRVPSRRIVVGLIILLVIAVLCVPGPALAFRAVAAGLGVLVVALGMLSPERRVLRLNGMDRYFIAQDYRGCPMNSHVFVELAAPLDRGSLEAAALAIHTEVPLLRSFIREAAFGVQRFCTAGAFASAAELVDWRDRPFEGDDLRLIHRRFALAYQPPLRVVHAPDGTGGARLVLTLHHAASDGEGMLLALDWLVQRYNDARTGAAREPLVLTREGLRLRDVVRERGKGLGWIVQMIRRHVRPTGKIGVVNASMLDDLSVTEVETRHFIGELGAADWKALGKVTEGKELTRNDVLLTAALRAADGYRRQRGQPDRPFRLVLPANLRESLGLGPGMQNFLGIVRTELSVDEVRSPDLPALVHERVRSGRSLEDVVETPVNLGFLSLLMPPWLLRRALKKLDADTTSSFFSFLFSHMRAATVRPIHGNTVLRTAIRGSMPRRPGFGLALLRDRDGLVVTVEYVHPAVQDASAAEFLRRFVDEVRAQLPAAPAARS